MAVMGDVWIFSPSGRSRFAAPEPVVPHSSLPVTVSMCGSNIVLRPGAVRDRPCTVEFVEMLNAALHAANVVLIDFEPVEEFEALQSRSPINASDDRWHEPATGPLAEVRILAAGMIAIPAAGSWWTIDLLGQRFCRSEILFDPRFVGGAAWTSIRALWVSASMLSVLTSADSFITSPRAEHEPFCWPETLVAS